MIRYFIFFIWKWVTETIDPVIGETMATLIKLVDRVRMLDNDMIRLNTKLSMVQRLQERSIQSIYCNHRQSYYRHYHLLPIGLTNTLFTQVKDQYKYQIYAMTLPAIA